MFLSKMQITNFRNYKSTIFDFKEGANTIIGENDAGKSNALRAIRILLDDTYYYSQKTLKDTDFNRSLGDWRGHWITISAEFSGMTIDESKREIISSIYSNSDSNEEDLNNLNLHISNTDMEIGNVSVIIRPNLNKRKELYEASCAGDNEKFIQIRQGITLSDYEFSYRSKKLVDFSDVHNYERIVGNLENCIAPNPDELQEKDSVIGARINISDVNEHISVAFIDALRDVVLLMSKGNNPIKKIVSSIENKIEESDIQSVREKIKELNGSISSISQLEGVQGTLNDKLIEILGLVYSPELSLSSNISDELMSLSKFLNLKPDNEEGLSSLGLGHLNMIYIALKIVEYNYCAKREILNIMLIEEPEAHIHHHIQKTLFKNLGIKNESTQVIMTTHSPNIAESSEISRMNIVKNFNNKTIAMNPSNGLDDFGNEKLTTKLSLTQSVERYLDAKRSAILFSKGLLLVEGDAEEILIPSLVRNIFGVTQDELGVGIVNIGSTAFEYIASLFSDERIQRRCAIVTDLDKQVVPEKSRFNKTKAAKKGEERLEKLQNLFGDNIWVEIFLADTTFEIELASSSMELYSSFLKISGFSEKTQKTYMAMFEGNNLELRNEYILRLAENVGKGWLATLLSQMLDSDNYNIIIPEYIIEALVFASFESVTKKIVEKMIQYSVGHSITVEDFINTNNDYKIKNTSLYIFVEKWRKQQGE